MSQRHHFTPLNPENKREELAGRVLELVPTGRNAQRSVVDRMRFYVGKETEVAKTQFYPANDRASRRAEDRAMELQRRKDQRNYWRREVAKERAASDLKNLFGIAEGDLPARDPWARRRAKNALDTRVKFLVDEDHKRFDREFAAHVANKDRIPVPRRPYRHEEVWAQLRAIAETATLPEPKPHRPVVDFPTTTPHSLSEARPISDFLGRGA